VQALAERRELQTIQAGAGPVARERVAR
jgi:hypothetical protein